MDYECDYGYSRPLGGNAQCKLDVSDSVWAEASKKRQDEQCDEYGYYEVTQGYRKIPGNICTGGIQLSPQVYYCKGLVSNMFTWTGMFMIAVMCGMVYYGWPILETILLGLPLPDPKHVKEMTLNYATRAWSYLKSLKSGAPSMASSTSTNGYH
jgi:hypothetical protein